MTLLRAAVALFALGYSSRAVAQADPFADRLTCFMKGFPSPVASTDRVTFRGADADATVGFNRKLGGIGVELTLTEKKSGASLQLVDARSAGGAGWQTSAGVLDSARRRIIHANQAAGNSANNWGYLGDYTVSPSAGIQQLDWLPMLTNDYLDGVSFDAPRVLTSPCRGGAERFGDGKMSLTPETVSAGGASVLRLTDSYQIRAATDQSWQWIQIDQALYLTLAAARIGQLRVYVAQQGHPVVGPILAESAFPAFPKGTLRNIAGHDGEWFFISLPMTYAVMVFRVGDQDIGIAIHMPDLHPFTGSLRYRGALFCHGGGDECGNAQWHTSTAMSRFDPSVPTRYRAGQISTYPVQYDIGTLAHLAALGFDTH